jgi:hypothetical protein
LARTGGGETEKQIEDQKVMFLTHSPKTGGESVEGSARLGGKSPRSSKDRKGAWQFHEMQPELRLYLIINDEKLRQQQSFIHQPAMFFSNVANKALTRME